MRIEITKGNSKKFSEELVSVASQARYFLKKPERKLTKIFKQWKILLVLCAVMFVLFLAMNIAWGFDMVSIAALAVLGLTGVYLAIFLFGYMRTRNAYMSDHRTVCLTLDNEGIMLEKEGAQTVKMAWENVSFLRLFEESMCFFPKELTGLLIFVDLEYSDRILEFIKNEKINVKIIH